MKGSTASSVRIRPFEESDRGFVIGLSDATQREMHRMDPDRHPPVLPGEAEAWFTEGLRTSWAQGCRIYIGEMDGEPAGYVILGPANDPWTWGPKGGPPRRKSGEIHELHVVRSYRRRGVGHALLLFAERELAKDGFGEVVIQHLARNAAASSLYAKAGYRQRHVLEVKRLRARRSR